MSDCRISVAQVIDSLGIGVTERIAVNTANLLPRNRFRAHLCSARIEGLLAKHSLRCRQAGTELVDVAE